MTETKELRVYSLLLVQLFTFGSSGESVERSARDQPLQDMLFMMVGVLGLKGTLALLGASRP